MFYFFSLSTIALIATTAILIIRAWMPRLKSEATVLFFLLVSVEISLLGYATSYAGKLASLEHWFVLSLLCLVPVWTITKAYKRFSRDEEADDETAPKATSFITELRAMSRPDFYVIAAMAITVFLCGVLTLILVIFTTPHVYDSLSYWIARIGYFLQQGSLDHLEANQFWIAHRPKIQTILMLFTFLATGGNENLMQLVNLLGYWVIIVSIYYLCMELELPRPKALFASLLFALLVNPLMVASSTQNDMLLPAYIAVAIGFAFAFKRSGRSKYLAASGLVVALAFNVKETFLFTVPAITLIILYALRWRGATSLNWRKGYAKAALIFGAFTIVFSALLMLPSGYWDNLRRTGNIIVVPKGQAEAHYFNLGSPGQYLKEATMNGARFTVDFISLDGLPHSNPVVRSAQKVLKGAGEGLFSTVGLDLRSNYGANHGNYVMDKPSSADSTVSYWGPLGWMLLWPVGILYVAGVFRGNGSWKRELYVLGSAAFVFFISQTLIGEYDMWRGRYFTPAAIMLAPLATVAIGTQRRYSQVFLIFVIALGSVSALSAMLLRDNNEMVGFNGKIPVYMRDRYAQLTREVEGIVSADAYRRFDAIVPIDATVAQWVNLPPLEYMYFGPELKRRVIPLTFWEDGGVRVPYNADYAVFHGSLLAMRKNDVPLGSGQVLRKLHPTMRFEDNIALAKNNGIAFVRTQSGAYKAPGLNDGNEREWSTTDGRDMVLAIRRTEPFVARTIQLALYQTGQIKDISVVATNDVDAPPGKWVSLRSRTAGQGEFKERITIQQGKDDDIVMLEVDALDKGFGAYMAYGVASFPGSGYAMNYSSKPGMALREIMISEAEPERFGLMLMVRDLERRSLSETNVVIDNDYYLQSRLAAPVGRASHNFGRTSGSALISAEKNLAHRQNKAYALASSSQSGFTVGALNDGTQMAWGASGQKDNEDTLFAVARQDSFKPNIIQLVLFSPGGKAHIKDLSVVASDDVDAPVKDWKVIRSRIKGDSAFARKITMPSGADGQVVTIEIDGGDPLHKPYKAYGLACLSNSAGYKRNYIPEMGGGVYVHEILMAR
ncbi:MAG: glycosyltransferase family 39 protein [Deltaproteobacteria bacterium]|nr:glycosyltransferase family 39 protein [Deltaproteobacteria bacterium]